MELIGYHGTCENSAKLICDNGFKLGSELGIPLNQKYSWLGDGVYFFYNLKSDTAIKHAQDWVKKVRGNGIKKNICEDCHIKKCDDCHVIVSTIKVEQNNVVDLVSDYDMIEEYRIMVKSVEDKLKTSRNNRRIDTSSIIIFLIESLRKKRNIDLIIAPVCAYGNNFNLILKVIPAFQTQLCVSPDCIIKSEILKRSK